MIEQRVPLIISSNLGGLVAFTSLMFVLDI